MKVKDAKKLLDQYDDDVEIGIVQWMSTRPTEQSIQFHPGEFTESYVRKENNTVDLMINGAKKAPRKLVLVLGRPDIK